MQIVTRDRLDELRRKTNIAFHQSIIDNSGDTGGDADIHYRKNVCKLCTQDLEDIVIAHHSGQQRRMQITLEAIKKELADRALVNGVETD